MSFKLNHFFALRFLWSGCQRGQGGRPSPRRRRHQILFSRNVAKGETRWSKTNQAARGRARRRGVRFRHGAFARKEIADSIKLPSGHLPSGWLVRPEAISAQTDVAIATVLFGDISAGTRGHPPVQMADGSLMESDDFLALQMHVTGTYSSPSIPTSCRLICF